MLIEGIKYIIYRLILVPVLVQRRLWYRIFHQNQCNQTYWAQYIV